MDKKQLDQIIHDLAQTGINLAYMLRYAVYDDEEQPTIGTPEEAHAVELSLSDAEVEHLLEDVD